MKEILLLVFGAIIGAGLMYLAYDMDYVPNDKLARYYELKKDTEAQIQSLTDFVDSLQNKRYNDSLETAERLRLNGLEIQRLKKGVKNVSFKEYTDTELDSLVEWLYPEPR